MKKIIYLLLLLFALNIYGQEHKTKQYEINTATAKDKKFFHQLDSIITNVYKLKYKYYTIYICSEFSSGVDFVPNINYIPQKDDSKLYLLLAGYNFSVIFKSNYQDFYEVKYNNRSYIVGKGAEDILISKKTKRTQSFPTLDNLQPPMLQLVYQNSCLKVVADSRKGEFH